MEGGLRLGELATNGTCRSLGAALRRSRTRADSTPGLALFRKGFSSGSSHTCKALLLGQLLAPLPHWVLAQEGRPGSTTELQTEGGTSVTPSPHPRDSRIDPGTSCFPPSYPGLGESTPGDIKTHPSHRHTSLHLCGLYQHLALALPLGLLVPLT